MSLSNRAAPEACRRHRTECGGTPTLRTRAVRDEPANRAAPEPCRGAVTARSAVARPTGLEPVALSFEG